MTDKTAPKIAAPEPPLPLHLYLSKLIDERDDLTNVKIAQRLGYARPNVIAMIKTGAMKLPINKVPELARLLGLDPVGLLKRVLGEYEPTTWDTLQTVFGSKLITENEMALVWLFRRFAGGDDPDLTSNPLFVAGLDALVGAAVDAEVAKLLATNTGLLRSKVTRAAIVNDQLRELTRRQALERQALRRKLIERSEEDPGDALDELIFGPKG